MIEGNARAGAGLGGACRQVLCVEPARVSRLGGGDAWGRDSDAFPGRARWEYARQPDGAWSVASDAPAAGGV